MACTTLEGFGQRLSASHSAILALLPQDEHATLEAFYARTVGAAGVTFCTTIIIKLFLSREGNYGLSNKMSA